MPDFIQELLPGQRGTRVYTDGVFQGYEDVYEVSDEELAQEEEDRLCKEYLSHSPDVITPPEIWYLLRCFAKKLGYEVK